MVISQISVEKKPRIISKFLPDPEFFRLTLKTGKRNDIREFQSDSDRGFLLSKEHSLDNGVVLMKKYQTALVPKKRASNSRFSRND